MTSVPQSKPEHSFPQGEALDEHQPVVRLVDESTTSIHLRHNSSPVAQAGAGNAASPTGAGIEASPAQPAPVALTIRRYVKRMPNHLSSSNNAGFENRGWHTVSLPFLSILSDMASPDGEVVI